MCSNESYEIALNECANFQQQVKTYVQCTSTKTKLQLITDDASKAIVSPSSIGYCPIAVKQRNNFVNVLFEEEFLHNTNAIGKLLEEL